MTHDLTDNRWLLEVTAILVAGACGSTVSPGAANAGRSLDERALEAGSTDEMWGA